MAHISFRKSNVLHKRAALHYPQLQNHSNTYNISQDILAILLCVIVDNTVYFPNCISRSLLQGRHAWPCGPSVLHTCLGFLSRILKENIFEHKFVCKLCFSSILNQKQRSDWTHATFDVWKFFRMCTMAHAE